MEPPEKILSEEDEMVESFRYFCKTYKQEREYNLLDIEAMVKCQNKIKKIRGIDPNLIDSLSNYISRALRKNNATKDSIEVCHSLNELTQHWVDDSEVVYVDMINIYVIFKDKKVMSDFIDGLIIGGSNTFDGKSVNFNPCQVIKLESSNGFYIVMNSRYDNNLVNKVKNAIKKTFGDYKIEIYSNDKLITFSIEDIKFSAMIQNKFENFMEAIKDDGDLSGKVNKAKEIFGRDTGFSLVPCCNYIDINGVRTDVGLLEIINLLSKNHHGPLHLTINTVNSNNTTNNNNSISSNTGVSVINTGNTYNNSNGYDSVIVDYILNNNPDGKKVSNYHNLCMNDTQRKLSMQSLGKIIRSMGYKTEHRVSGNYWKKK
jgi:hypothetical protein